MKNNDNNLSAKFKPIRRAYTEFLKLPILMVLGFIALAFFISWLDHSGFGWILTLRSTIIIWLLSNPDATSSLLGTMATGMLTVTSITISLLLIAVQQAASALTPQVFDQFLRRIFNQLFFGLFIGLCIFLLLTLASADKNFNPVLGAMVGLILTIIALVSLLAVLYATIEQMRPIYIIDAIHDLTLAARRRQGNLLRKTRRQSLFNGKIARKVYARKHGFVTNLDLNKLGLAAKAANDETETILHFVIGSFVAYNDCIAEIKANNEDDAKLLSDTLHNALRLEVQRNMTYDPDYGILQLEMIAWTSVSTAKSNPDPGLLMLYSLRNLLCCWFAEEDDRTETKRPHQKPSPDQVPVVLADNVVQHIFDVYESMTVVASESMQHQTSAVIITELDIMYSRLPDNLQADIRAIVLRSMSSLGEHVPTRVLSQALERLVETFRNDGQTETADIVARQLALWQASLNSLNSRATRARPES